ncbi:hypothetical protein M0813_21709 [Anaeramoeba flamelloides]|uniref:Uncharacterized protein n=1 Tax=Anaeramoeba flamelloides TaxID=1746091 RepID=A0ABQ8YH45_9EUKA|nr:hypothetical protein M0813_21709 [Anaeramoeba flamelloides]
MKEREAMVEAEAMKVEEAMVEAEVMKVEEVMVEADIEATRGVEVVVMMEGIEGLGGLEVEGAKTRVKSHGMGRNGKLCSDNIQDSPYLERSTKPTYQRQTPKQNRLRKISNRTQNTLRQLIQNENDLEND